MSIGAAPAGVAFFICTLLHKVLHLPNTNTIIMFLKNLDIQALQDQDDGSIDECVFSKIESNVKQLRSFKEDIKNHNKKIEFDQIAESFNDLYDEPSKKKIKKLNDVIPRDFIKKCSLMVNSRDDAWQFFDLFKRNKDFNKGSLDSWVYDLMPNYKKYLELKKQSFPICDMLENITKSWKLTNEDYFSGNDREFEIMYKKYVVVFGRLNKLIKQQERIYKKCYFVQGDNLYCHKIYTEHQSRQMVEVRWVVAGIAIPEDFKLLQERMRHINQRRKAKRYGVKAVEPKAEELEIKSNIYHYSYLLCYDRNGVIEAKIGITGNPKNREKAISNTMFPFKNITLRWKCKADAKNFEQMLLKMSERYKVHEGYGEEWIRFENNDLFEMWFNDQYMLCEKLATESYGVYKESHVEPKDVLCSKINTIIGKLVYEENGPCPHDEFQYKCKAAHKKANIFAKIKKKQSNATERQLKIKLEYLEKQLKQLKQ